MAMLAPHAHLLAVEVPAAPAVTLPQGPGVVLEIFPLQGSAQR